VQTQLADRGVPSAANPALLEMRRISKCFPGVQALREVSLACSAGEVHALVGENGAGKSTLMKILAGVERPDAGQILLDGMPVHFGGPRDALRAGISIIYQEFNLLPELTVLENIYAGRERRLVPGILDWAGMRRDAAAVLERLGIALDLQAYVWELSVAQQQLVEMARALSLNARLVIMDEPSTVLAGQELERLFATIGALKAQGVAVIYISHRLEEVFKIADRATVLRDGQVTATLNPKETTREALIRLMVGRALHESAPADASATREPVLEVRDLSAEGFLRDISFTLHRGEILGVAGLVGAGRTTLARALFGAARMTAGQIILAGKPLTPRSPGRALRAVLALVPRFGLRILYRCHPNRAVHAGVALVPEDRKGQGLVLNLTVAQNISLPILERLTRRLLLHRGRQETLVAGAIRDLDIRTPSAAQPVQYLSGGNQQKVVLAKWLITKPRVLIMDEPTRGVDVGAKAEIYAIMRRLAAGGTSILMISSELPELLAMADRILVMAEGRLAGELRAADATEEAILSLAVGEHARR
jgi:ABC-type sugar transport system ATPase subunit